MPAVKSKITRSKRGDTIIEVMFAFAIFTMVATLTTAMMNSGLSASERTLELVTARNEINAQAEALRFIHSSYISELKLPVCSPALPTGEKCQQYDGIWDKITNELAISASVFKDSGIKYPPTLCADVYKDDNNLLIKNHAFVLNTRDLLSEHHGGSITDSLVVANATTKGVFVEPALNARIIYGSNIASDDPDKTSEDNMNTLTKYTKVLRAEGVWVIAVKGPTTKGSDPQYYDFYIDTCWNGTNNPVPTAIDTVIRLYNPAGA